MNALGNVAASASKVRTIRVFVVEDSALIRERLVRLLEGLSGVKVVGHAESATDAIANIVSTQPDAVVLDIKLKAGSGIEVLRAIKHRMPEVAVIMLTNYATEEYRQKCRQEGAEYFLDKTNEFENLRPIFDWLNRNHLQGDPSC
ncbi:MAG TPA: response regulator transcription factor [Burkholderiales bacterium]|nr:response regulator transcription factor [Burkholderiales bacterium]